MTQAGSIFARRDVTIGFLVLVGCFELYLLKDHFRSVTIEVETRQIAVAGVTCLLENKIETPQSEAQMAALLYAKNPKGIDYLLANKGLKPSGDKDIRDDYYDMNYRIRFNGSHVVVHSNESERPYILELNSVEKD